MMRKDRVAHLIGVVFFIGWAASAQAAPCGDGVTQADEECDDGGVCIGGSNAGTQCTDEGQCMGDGVCDGGLRPDAACATDDDCPVGHCIHCKTFGGDGCAANCTLESNVPFTLVPGDVQGTDLAPGTSGTTLHGIFSLATPLSGSLVLTVGKPRDGQIPVVIPEAGVSFPAVSIPSLACSCQRGALAKTCGGTLFERDGVTRSIDCTASDSACAGRKPCTFLHGAGNAAAGVIGCDDLEGVDVTINQQCLATNDAPFGLSAKGGAGSAVLLISTAEEAVAGFCPSGPKYGPDQMFCTSDDPPDPTATVTTVALVTGTASGQVGSGPGSASGSATGAPFSCAALQAPTPNTAGVVLVSVSTDEFTQGVQNEIFAAAPGPPNTPAATPTGPTPTVTPTPPPCTDTPAPTATVTRTPTSAVLETPSATQAPTDTAAPTATASPIPSETPSDTPTTNPTSTATEAATSGPTEVASGTPVGTATITPTLSPSEVPTNVPTNAPTATETAVPAETPTNPPPTNTAPPTPACAGDCDGDGSVTVNEIITMVNIALGNADVATCRAGDQDGSGTITINEIITAVNNALNGCPT